MKIVRKFLSKISVLEEYIFKSSEIRRIYEIRRHNVIPVRQPLLLISQVQRSGGTMLSQMFDGHSECWSHPHEIKIGRPQKENWPDLDLKASPGKWFDGLFENDTCLFFRQGFRKGREANPKSSTYPFVMLPGLQKKIFLDLCSQSRPANQRQILDHYFTAYFNSWLDCQGFYREKRWVTAFVPKLACSEKEISGFFRDYPDGKLISLVRNPGSWFASYRVSKTKHYNSAENMLAQWVNSASAMVQNKKNHPDRVLNLSFEDLLKNPDANLEKICAFMKIKKEPALAVPTFQTMAIAANSHFDVEKVGLMQAPLERKGVLGEEDLKLVEKMANPVYEQVLKILD